MNAEQRRAQELIANALACYRMPALHGDVLRGELPVPAEITVLIRLAGGSEAAEIGLAPLPERDMADLRAAARFYLEQTLFRKSADHYRLLGVQPDADGDLIKEHYRLLMRMLHPDRAGDTGGWQDGFSNRVNQAYDVLRSDEKRAAYDARLNSLNLLEAIELPQTRPYIRPAGDHAYPPRVSRSAQTAPKYIMMGALLMAVLYVGLVYMSNEYGRAATSGPSALAVPQGLPEVPPANGLAASGLAELRARAGHDVPALRPEPTMASVRADADTTSTPARTMSGMPRGAGQPSAPDKATQPLASRGGDPARSSPSAPAAVMPVATVQSYAPPLQPLARSEPMLTPALSIRSGPASASAGTMAPTSPAVQERQVAAMPAADAEPVRTASSHVLSGADLERLLDRYIYFYERGDINGFMSLFDDAARTESGGKMKIRQEYERFFQATQYRRLELTIPPVAEGVDAYVGKVPFRATVKRQSESQVGVFTGALYFEVEKRQGRAMITTLFFTLG